jgi:carboxymethylenebutenolidase
MGGRTAFLAAATVPVACAVSYYGGGIAPNPMTGGLLARAGDIQAPCLFFWGGLDKHITPEQTLAVTQAMREAGKVWTSVEFSFADHGFSCDARASYNAEATKQAWAMTLAFLETHLGG